jgi:hypothetical protein
LVLGLELRAYTFSHSTSLFLQWVFLRSGLVNYLPRAGFEPQFSRSLPPE